jgi:hypothetical protein
MHGTWIVKVTRLNGKPHLRNTLVRGRAPAVGEVVECAAKGETVRGKIVSVHHVSPKGQGNLGIWEIAAEEVA